MFDLQSFDFADGQIKSILIEPRSVIVSYCSWDDKEYEFVFKECTFLLNNISYADIGGAIIQPLEKDTLVTFSNHTISLEVEGAAPNVITLFDSSDDVVLIIAACSVEINEI